MVSPLSSIEFRKPFHFRVMTIQEPRGVGELIMLNELNLEQRVFINFTHPQDQFSSSRPDLARFQVKSEQYNFKFERLRERRGEKGNT